MTSQEFYEALESIVESKHWRWMIGMTTDTQWLVVDPQYDKSSSMMLMVCDERMAVSADYRLPDVTQAGTQGGMIAIICDCVEALEAGPISFRRWSGDAWEIHHNRLDVLADEPDFDLALVKTMSRLFDLMDEQGVQIE